MKPQPRHYRPVWEAHHGPLPARCAFCGELVHEWGRGRHDGVIHHRDEDRTNNDPENLALAHRRCHTAHHSTGCVKSAATRAKMRAKALGEGNPNASLTAADVAEIRRLLAAGGPRGFQQRIAARFAVSATTITRIKRGGWPSALTDGGER